MHITFNPILLGLDSRGNHVPMVVTTIVSANHKRNSSIFLGIPEQAEDTNDGGKVR